MSVPWTDIKYSEDQLAILTCVAHAWPCADQVMLIDGTLIKFYHVARVQLNLA